VPAARRLSILLAAIAVVAALVVPAGAAAQSTSVPQLRPTVKEPSKSSKKHSSPSRATSQLPNTGVDARLLAAIGAALLLCGIGLRLRSTEESF
jgi:LPXTG-motif cell wall-anchored protein